MREKHKCLRTSTTGNTGFAMNGHEFVCVWVGDGPKCPKHFINLFPLNISLNLQKPNRGEAVRTITLLSKKQSCER